MTNRLDHFRDDPRLAGMGYKETRIMCPAEMPTPGESRYLIVLADEPTAFPKWENEPEGYFWGNGRGLPEMAEPPRFRLPARKKQITQPDFWPWRHRVYLITKRMVDLIEEFDPSAIEARPADFRFSDDLEPDEPYFMVDFVQNLNAVDYDRSIVHCQTSDISLEPQCGYRVPCALRPDIPETVHVFRHVATPPASGWKAGGWRDLFFSRAIIDGMVRRRFRRMSFRDPAIGDSQYLGDVIILDGKGHPQ